MKRAIPLVVVLALSAAVPSGAAPHSIGHTEIFTRIGEPGSPEGLLVDGGLVYVGTHVSVRGNGGGPPSKIFVYDLGTHALVEEIAIEGQDLSRTHGILGMAMDAARNLFVLDRYPGRVIRIDAVTRAQSVYATIPDLPACRPVAGPTADCAPVTVDEPTFADYLAFAPDGSLYVTDLQAATIFRVPAGGGSSEIWYQDARFDGIFGLNGIAVDPGRSRLVFAMTGSQQPGTLAQGIIYTLPLAEDPQPSDLAVFHVFPEPAAGPDGLGFGADGKLYVAMAGGNQVSIVSADGSLELARFPDAVANAQQEIPYDLPASVAFDGAGSLLVTNQSFFAGDASHWAVLRAWVNDTGLPLVRPELG